MNEGGNEMLGKGMAFGAFCELPPLLPQGNRGVGRYNASRVSA